MTDQSDRLSDPTSKDEIDHFLDEVGQTCIFELQYRDGGEERTRIVTEVLADFSDLRPSATPLNQPPSVRATTVTPTETNHMFVPVEDIDAITAFEPRDELFPVTGRTPGERAEQLKRYANAAPTVVSVSDILELLHSDDEGANVVALEALESIAHVRPQNCLLLVPQLRELAAEETGPRQVQTLACLRTLSAEVPGDIVPSVDEIAPNLLADSAPTRKYAIQCFSNVADDYADDLLDHAEAVATLVRTGTPGQTGYAAYVLNRMADVDPAIVEPHVSALRRVLLRDDVSDCAQSNVIAALGRVTKEHPGVVGDTVDDVAPLLEAESVKLRANAAGLLADISLTDPAAVFGCTDELVEMLDDEDDHARANASGTLSRVIEADRHRLDGVVPTFIDLLEDDHPIVRENACWALGHAEADAAVERLDELRTGDPEENVRVRASWALHEIGVGRW